MSQSSDNKKWRQNVPSNIGMLGLLVPPKVKTSLPKPYQYEAPIAAVQDMVRQLKIEEKSDRKLQCYLVATKPVSKGIRLTIFMLGYQPGLCGESGTGAGLDKSQWEAMTGTVRMILEHDLGKVPLYVEPWRKGKKFQARFETYIKYSEL
jgi:hypothetical protein